MFLDIFDLIKPQNSISIKIRKSQNPSTPDHRRTSNTFDRGPVLPQREYQPRPRRCNPARTRSSRPIVFARPDSTINENDVETQSRRHRGATSGRLAEDVSRRRWRPAFTAAVLGVPAKFLGTRGRAAYRLKKT